MNIRSMRTMKSNRRFGVVIVFLAILLASSIVLNFVFYRQGNEYYLQLNETRLDPLGLNDFARDSGQPDKTHADKKIVVLFGDSRAGEWNAPTLSKFEFVNRGIGAQTSAQVAQRFEYHVRPLQPRIIIVQVGINDLKTIPLFPERQNDIIANCKANLRQIITQSTNIDAHVILTTIFPLGQIPLERKPFWSDDVAVAIDDVNKYIVSLKSENIEIFDTVPILTDGNGKVKSIYSKDFLHLSNKGYEALNAELVRILLRY